MKEGDVISWHGKSVKSEYYSMMSKALGSKTVPGWLTLDKEKIVGKVLSLPTPDDIEAKYNIASVVEYYSR